MAAAAAAPPAAPAPADAGQEAGTMLALTFGGRQRIVLARVPLPTLQLPTDVLVRVTLCGICGSDLHPYHEREKGLAPGCVVGHEFCGVVTECGAQVERFAVGDRVMSPFTTSCGACFYCKKGITCRCSHPEGGRCFGWVSEGQQQQGLQGSQTQFVRVPLADGTLVKVPDEVSDEEAILLGDILSTASFCVDEGGVGPGDAVAVCGCGPVGLLAVMAARQRGAAHVIAIDGVPERRARAAQLGATATADIPDASAAVAAATDGRGADVALELVGGGGAALGLAAQLLRPAGTLSSIGVHTAPAFPFSPVDAYDKNLTLRCGRCPARAYMSKLLPALVASKQQQQQVGDGSSSSAAAPAAPRWTDVISHRMPLSQGVEAYQIFDAKAAGCTKVVLDPWA